MAHSWLLHSPGGVGLACIFTLEWSRILSSYCICLGADRIMQGIWSGGVVPVLLELHACFITDADYDYVDQGCADGGYRPPPQHFQICKKVGQKSAMLQERLPQYFLWPFFSKNSWSIGQNALPQQEVPRHITDVDSRDEAFSWCYKGG